MEPTGQHDYGTISWIVQEMKSLSYQDTGGIHCLTGLTPLLANMTVTFQVRIQMRVSCTCR